MPINRLNHAVLYVRDVATSVAFYRDVLEFQALIVIPQAAFLRTADSTNDHDLGLFQVGADGDAGAQARVGLYHLAWEVDSLSELRRLRTRLEQAGALVGASDHGTTKSLYGHDPDGLEFEICWLVPGAQISEHQITGRFPAGVLDVEAEIARFGAHTPGGSGLPVVL